MAKNISLLGADYPDVPAVTLPKTGGGTATFYDVEVTDGDPTLAWETRSTVGTINGTDLHVTMPEAGTIVSNADGRAHLLPNGTMIVQKTVEHNSVACSAAWGSAYESDPLSLGAWPYSFKTGTSPTVTISCLAGNCTFESLTDVSETSAGKVRVMRPVSGSIASVKIAVIAVGMWK